MVFTSAVNSKQARLDVRKEGKKKTCQEVSTWTRVCAVCNPNPFPPFFCTQPSCPPFFLSEHFGKTAAKGLQIWDVSVFIYLSVCLFFFVLVFLKIRLNSNSWNPDVFQPGCRQTFKNNRLFVWADPKPRPISTHQLWINNWWLIGARAGETARGRGNHYWHVPFSFFFFFFFKKERKYMWARVCASCQRVCISRVCSRAPRHMCMMIARVH